jgi:putative nucleotidyltransferase with HDIG domain
MDREQIKQEIYAHIDEIPTIPVVIARLLGMLSDSNVKVSELTKVISGDPALTAKVLGVANSAYYGFSQQIASLDRAVALLGLNMVKSLALSIGVMQNLPKVEDMQNLSAQGLWLHSLAVATVAKELSLRLGKPAEEDHLFVVGLLHDVGKIVLMHYFKRYYQLILAKTQGQGASALYRAEQGVMGFDHGEVGAILLNRWKFPKQVVLPIHCHHLGAISRQVDQIDVAIVKVADVIPQVVGMGEHGNEEAEPIDPTAMKLLKLTPQDIESLEKYLKREKDKLENFFDAMT